MISSIIIRKYQIYRLSDVATIVQSKFMDISTALVDQIEAYNLLKVNLSAES